MDHFRTFRDTKKKAVENQRLAEKVVETRRIEITSARCMNPEFLEFSCTEFLQKFLHS